MLKIQVFGKGLIPRGYGLAPRKEPFSADLSLITLIMNTAGLTVNYIHPETKNSVPLTRESFQKVYRTYSSDVINTTKKASVKPEEKKKEENISDGPEEGKTDLTSVTLSHGTLSVNSGNPHDVTAEKVGLGNVEEPKYDRANFVPPSPTTPPPIDKIGISLPPVVSETEKKVPEGIPYLNPEDGGEFVITPRFKSEENSNIEKKEEVSKEDPKPTPTANARPVVNTGNKPGQTNRR